MDCSPPGSSVHGNSQARILEWVALSFSTTQDWNLTQGWNPCFLLGRQILPQWTTWEVQLLSFSSVQSLSRVQLFATPWIAARQASLSITNSRSLLKLMSIESVMPSSHLILCRPLLLLPPIPPSIRVFSNESTLRMRWPKYWSFSFSISSSKELPGLVWSPCSPRDYQESTPTPKFKSINSSSLSFLHLTYWLRNLYAGQEATIRTRGGTTDWF